MGSQLLFMPRDQAEQTFSYKSHNKDSQNINSHNYYKDDESANHNNRSAAWESFKMSDEADQPSSSRRDLAATSARAPGRRACFEAQETT